MQDAETTEEKNVDWVLSTWRLLLFEEHWLGNGQAILNPNEILHRHCASLKRNKVCG